MALAGEEKARRREEVRRRKPIITGRLKSFDRRPGGEEAEELKTPHVGHLGMATPWNIGETGGSIDGQAATAAGMP